MKKVIFFKGVKFVPTLKAYLYYNGPIKTILGTLSKLSPTEMIYLRTQQFMHPEKSLHDKPTI